MSLKEAAQSFQQAMSENTANKIRTGKGLTRNDFIKLSGIGLGLLGLGSEALYLLSISGCSPGLEAPSGVKATATPGPEGFVPTAPIMVTASPENHGTLPTAVPYPTTTEGFAYGIGGNEAELTEQINRESLGDSARVEYVVKWAAYRADHSGLFYSEKKSNGQDVLVQEPEVLDYYSRNYETRYSVVPGKSWSLAAQNKNTREFFVAVDPNNETPFFNLIPGDTNGDGIFSTDEFGLSKISMPEWADGQALIPVTEGKSRGYSVIVFTNKGEMAGWYDAANNQVVKGEQVEVVPQKIIELIAEKKLELRDGKIYNGEVLLGNLVVKGEVGFLQLEATGSKYELNLESLVHTLPKSGETHLWFNEDTKDAVWGADKDQKIMFQVREGKWEINGLEVNWPESLDQAIKLVDPDQIDTYMEANQERWMKEYSTGLREKLGLLYNRPDTGYNRIELYSYGEDTNRDRRTGVFQLALKWTDHNEVTWIDNNFSIFPNRVYYTDSNGVDFMVTFKASAFSRNLSRSDNGRVDWSEEMSLEREYADDVMSILMDIVNGNEKDLLVVGVIGRGDQTPYFDRMIEKSQLPEYFITQQSPVGLMKAMQEFDESLKSLTQKDKDLFKNLFPVALIYMTARQ